MGGMHLNMQQAMPTPKGQEPLSRKGSGGKPSARPQSGSLGAAGGGVLTSPSELRTNLVQGGRRPSPKYTGIQLGECKGEGRGGGPISPVERGGGVESTQLPPTGPQHTSLAPPDGAGSKGGGWGGGGRRCAALVPIHSFETESLRKQFRSRGSAPDCFVLKCFAVD